MSVNGFETLWLIPGSPESTVHVEGYAGLCTCPGKTWEGSNRSSMADREAICKQGVKAKAELFYCLSAEAPIHSPSANPGGLTGPRLWGIFNDCVQSLAGH